MITSALPQGTHAITAEYPGDSEHKPATGQLSLVIGAAKVAEEGGCGCAATPAGFYPEESHNAAWK
jgi:hypothetical protein